MAADPNSRPKSYLAVSPAAVGVLGVVLVVAVVAVFKLLPPPTPATAPAPAYPDLSPRVAELEQQLAAAKSAPPPYPDLTERVSALEATQTELQKLLAEAQAAPEYTVLRNRIAALASELEGTRDALAAARKGGAEARAERDEVASRIDRLTRDLAQLRADRERMEKLLTETGRQMRQTSAQKTALSDREANVAKIIDELRDTRAALATAQDEASRTSEALATLQRSTDRALADSAADRARLDELRSTNASLVDENQRLRAAVATPPPASPSPPAYRPSPAVGRTHFVAAGDSLSNLSQRYYGTPERWREIYTANADLLGPTGTLRVGTMLRIP